MRREHVSEWELAAMLRQDGLERGEWQQVRQAWFENAGELSVLREEAARDAQRSDAG